MSRIRTTLALALFLLLALTSSPASATPLEDYASYQPQTKCSPRAKPGTTYLGKRLVKRFGGGFGPISRSCGSGGTSEHKEGRAFDWMLDASKKSDRKRAHEFMDWVFSTDGKGNEDARARRMGIMYVIWKDHMYSAWNGFERRSYLSSSCKSRRKCSTTLRHRDHLHVSLTRKGGKGRTSWYVGRLPAE